MRRSESNSAKRTDPYRRSRLALCSGPRTEPHRLLEAARLVTTRRIQNNLDNICLIGSVDETVEGYHECNRYIGLTSNKLRFYYGCARVNPRFGEERTVALEDQCQRYPETDLPGVVEDRYNAGQAAHLRSVLDESPDADPAIVGTYSHMLGNSTKQSRPTATGSTCANTDAPVRPTVRRSEHWRNGHPRRSRGSSLDGQSGVHRQQDRQVPIVETVSACIGTPRNRSEEIALPSSIRTARGRFRF